jgi:Cdk activating kinase (CAK)/RNA polymerase II transcription initiation/nucleotide excision repair factor TFIIH/TFIIK, cyclin H subunit
MSEPQSNANVDRTVHQVIPNSVLCNKLKEDSAADFLYRINGTSIIFQSAKLLRLPSSVYATSATIFHRFYHRETCTFDKYDVWSVAMASILLACKVEEEVRRIREIIIVFIHVYRRMRLGLGSVFEKSSTYNTKLSSNISLAFSDLLREKNLTDEEKKNILRYIRPIPQYGILYKEWEEQIMDTENTILRELGFVLYWIPGSHPHTFLLYFMKILGIDEKAVAQYAWNCCNDSCRLDLCVRYPPEMTACAAIHLACIKLDVSLPMDPRPWWESFVGQGKSQELSNICNAILALGDVDCVEGYFEASNTYLISLVKDGSFCDPGSYSWNAME